MKIITNGNQKIRRKKHKESNLHNRAIEDQSPYLEMHNCGSDTMLLVAIERENEEEIINCCIELRIYCTTYELFIVANYIICTS